MKNKQLKNFIYIDDAILTMYFSQLPSDAQIEYENQFSRDDLRWTLSLNPRLQGSQKKISVPKDQAVSLAMFIEKYLTSNGYDIVNFQTLDGQLILDKCMIAYMYINDGDGHNLFLGIPEEIIHEKLKREGKTFIILGDISNCLNLRAYHDYPKLGTSPLRRIERVWREIRNNVSNDIHGWKFDSSAYNSFSDGREGVFDALWFLSRYAHQKSLVSELKGLYLHRDSFEKNGEEIHVLYPIYIERISLSSSKK